MGRDIIEKGGFEFYVIFCEFSAFDEDGSEQVIGIFAVEETF